MNMITTNIDVNELKMKEKLDFGQLNGLRRENKPLPSLTPEQMKEKIKIKRQGIEMMDNFLEKRKVMH